MTTAEARWVGVVVPAHDEQAVLGATLRALLAQQGGVRLEIVVVAAGCSDDTAAIAREILCEAVARGHQFHVHEIDEASKPSALNAGDAILDAAGAARAPLVARLYLDADAVLSPGAVDACVEAIADGAHLVAPGVRFVEPDGARARRFLRVYRILPNVRESPSNRGCYLVSVSGRARWSRFPESLPDDAFVRAQFAPTETVVVHGQTSCVDFPDDDRLIPVLARWREGNAALGAARPPYPIHRAARRSGVWAIVRAPSVWTSVPTFLRIRRRAIRFRTSSWARSR